MAWRQLKANRKRGVVAYSVLVRTTRAYSAPCGDQNVGNTLRRLVAYAKRKGLDFGADADGGVGGYAGYRYGVNAIGWIVEHAGGVVHSDLRVFVPFLHLKGKRIRFAIAPRFVVLSYYFNGVCILAYADGKLLDTCSNGNGYIGGYCACLQAIAIIYRSPCSVCVADFYRFWLIALSNGKLYHSPLSVCHRVVIVFLGRRGNGNPLVVIYQRNLSLGRCAYFHRCGFGYAGDACSINVFNRPRNSHRITIGANGGSVAACHNFKGYGQRTVVLHAVNSARAVLLHAAGCVQVFNSRSGNGYRVAHRVGRNSYCLIFFDICQRQGIFTALLSEIAHLDLIHRCRYRILEACLQAEAEHKGAVVLHAVRRRTGRRNNRYAALLYAHAVLYRVRNHPERGRSRDGDRVGKAVGAFLPGYGAGGGGAANKHFRAFKALLQGERKVEQSAIRYRQIVLRRGNGNANGLRHGYVKRF